MPDKLMEASMNFEVLALVAIVLFSSSFILFFVGRQLKLKEPCPAWGIYSSRDRRIKFLKNGMFYGALLSCYGGAVTTASQFFLKEIDAGTFAVSLAYAFVLYRICESIRWKYMCHDGFISHFFYYLEPLAIGIVIVGACSFFGPSLYELLITASLRGFRDFMLGNSWMNLLVAAYIMFICWCWSDSLDDGKGGIKTLFGSSYFPNSGWRSKTVSRFGNGVFLTCLLAVAYRVAFIRTEQVGIPVQSHAVSFVFQESQTVRCGRRWCTQILYRARTPVGERSVPSYFVTSGTECDLTDYEGYSVLKDKLTGETVNAWNYRTYAWLTISKDCTR